MSEGRYAIELRRVTKTYVMGKGLRVEALRGVTLGIEHGEFVSIMGPSGSGKTTLLNIMGTMDRPTSGRVIIDGMDVTDLSESKLAVIRREKIGFVFQFYNLLSTLTALDNVVLPLLLTGKYTESEARERATYLLEMVGLGDRLHHRPYELSGGQQQRVAIARALANNPSFVLMDEPTGAVDTATGARIMNLCKLLNRYFGQTFVVVTHNPAVAKMAERMYYIRDGMISEGQPPEDFYSHALDREEVNRLVRLQLKLLEVDLRALRRLYSKGGIEERRYNEYKRAIAERLGRLEAMVMGRG